MPEESGQSAPDGATGQGASDDAGQGALDDARRDQQSNQDGTQDSESSRTIARLNSEAKANREKAEAAMRELAEIKKGQMSELERATAESKEKDAKVESLTKEIQGLHLQNAAVAAAMKAKAVDPNLVFRALDKDQVEFDSDGNPTNLDSLLNALKREHPVLFHRVQGEGDNGARGGSASGSGSMSDLIRQKVASKR